MRRFLCSWRGEPLPGLPFSPRTEILITPRQIIDVRLKASGGQIISTEREHRQVGDSGLHLDLTQRVRENPRRKEAAVTKDPPLHDAQRPQGRRLRVLLVDPIADESEMYSEYLSFAGFDVTRCRDAEQALAIVGRGAVSAVIARIRQAGAIDGIELARRMKQNPATTRTPIVIITTHIQPEFRRAAERAGCDAFILLPCVPDQLVCTLDHVLSATEGS